MFARVADPIPSRDQIPLTDTWDLTALYESSKDWNEAFVALQNSYEGITRLKGGVADSAETLRDCLDCEKRLNLQIERLGHYASLRASEDCGNADNLSRESRLDNLLTRIA